MAITPIVGTSTVFDKAFWLAAANQAVRTECGWHVAPVITETLRMDGSGGRTLTLPTQRIVSVTRVLNDGEDVTERVKYSQMGMLSIDGRFSREFGSIEVVLEHGFPLDEVADVAGLIAALTARAASAPAGVVSQSLGPAAVRHSTGADGANLSIPLLQSEKNTLARFRLI